MRRCRDFSKIANPFNARLLRSKLLVGKHKAHRVNGPEFATELVYHLVEVTKRSSGASPGANARPMNLLGERGSNNADGLAMLR